ncbi:hypothetical protein, partial [Dyella sp.]|uniref:hypothetical protein n=1 Tax=Dyella sp. TaxID=1869338 RepID=UPI002D7821D8
KAKDDRFIATLLLVTDILGVFVLNTSERFGPGRSGAGPVDADVKLTHRADWILTRGYDALSVVVGV